MNRISSHLFDNFFKHIYQLIPHCNSYSPHLVIVSYFSFLPSHFISMEQMLMLMLTVQNEELS